MPDILLTFHSDVEGERQDAILAQVKRLPGVTAAAPINRNAPGSFRRFSFARVEAPYTDQVAEALQSYSEIETTEMAPQRGL